MAKSGKTLDCKLCHEPVDNVGAEATAVTCYKCVSKMLREDPRSGNDCES